MAKIEIPESALDKLYELPGGLDNWFDTDDEARDFLAQLVAPILVEELDALADGLCCGGEVRERADRLRDQPVTGC